MSTQSDEPSRAGQMHQCAPVEPQRPTKRRQEGSPVPQSATPRPDLDEREVGTSPERKPSGPPTRRRDAGEVDEAGRADGPLGASAAPSPPPTVPEAILETPDDDQPLS